MIYIASKLMLVLPPILAQETPEIVKTITGIAFLDSILAPIGGNLGSSILNFLFAIIVLVVGWIVAGIVKSIVKGLLSRTNIDNKVAGWMSGREGEDSLPIEEWISEVVYWVIILFVVVAFLQTLQLEAVSEPLNALLEQITSFLPKIGGALILLALAWLLATLVKMLVTRTLRAFRVDERLGQQVGGERTTTTTTPASSTTTGNIPPRATGTTPSTTSSQFSLSETIANTLYWFIFLLFLPSILSTLELEGTLQPVQGLVDKILSILPNILAAILIGFVGWTIAQIVRKVVTNLLAATGTDRIGARFGLSTATGGKSLSWIIGTVVYVLVLIPVAIAALQALKIEAISEPAIAMLNDILTVLPQIFTAAVILTFAYVAGKYLAELVTSILTSIGFNNLPQWLGLSFVTTPRTPSRMRTPSPGIGEPTAIQPSIPSKTPSELVGIIVLVGIMLVAALTAVDILNIPALTNLVGAIVLIAGQVLTGIVIFAIGLYLANLAFNLITSSGNRQSRILAQTARIAIIALVSAMALQQMGIASSIVNLAFGLLLGAIAIAIALAFGLGSRDIAAEQVREWLNSFKRD